MKNENNFSSETYSIERNNKMIGQMMNESIGSMIRPFVK